MSAPLTFYCDDSRLYDEKGRAFDPAVIAFTGAEQAIDQSWQPLTPREAVAWLQKRPERIRPPVAVIGPREASARQREIACQIGRDLAEVGLTVICGGRQGVMEAVCKGVAERGGVSLGLLPDDDWKHANPYVTIPVATGIGIARNALIARAAHVMLSVGAGLGTISEMALGLQFNKQVFSVHDQQMVPGVRVFAEWEAMAPHFYAAVLNAAQDV